MKKYIIAIILGSLIGFAGIVWAGQIIPSGTLRITTLANCAGRLYTSSSGDILCNTGANPALYGGTGTAIAPTAGQVLVGQANGTYLAQATSTLGIIGIGGGVSTTTSNTWAGTQTFSVIKTATTSAFCAFNASGVLIATTTPATALSGGTTNFLSVWTSATTIGATSSPTLGFIRATSSTASTFAGSVGIATSTPATTLDVYGTTTTRNLIVNDGSTTGTTTVAIGNPKRAVICWWNGTNYTNEYYPPNSVTKVVATSTTCQ